MNWKEHTVHIVHHRYTKNKKSKLIVQWVDNGKALSTPYVRTPKRKKEKKLNIEWKIMYCTVPAVQYTVCTPKIKIIEQWIEKNVLYVQYIVCTPK